MLFNYMKQTQRLLRENRQDSINPQDLIDYINTARGQVAGTGECVRSIGTIATVPGQRNYSFSAISLGTSSATGIQGAINVRRVSYNSGSGQVMLYPRSWPWFDLFYLNNTAPINGPPAQWAQYAQGAIGSFYIDPPPDIVYTLNCDCVCYPINLTKDSDVEAIPYLWTDAVSYFAAHLGLIELQRLDDAMKLFAQYKIFIDFARNAANPAVDRYIYSQASDPVQAAKLGMKVS